MRTTIASPQAPLARPVTTALEGGVPSPMSQAACWTAWGALVALQIAHLFARQAGWVVDMRWASSQYLFSITLLGPLLAGIAAYQGRGAARLVWVLRAAPVRSVVGWLRGPLGIGVTVFVAGWCAVEVVAISSGATWNLTFATVRNLVSALLGVGAYAAAGFAMGALWPRRLVPAVAMIATFALTMVAWTGLAPSLVWFGGASAGVTGTELSTAATIARVVFDVAVVILAMVIAARALGADPPHVSALVPGTVMIVAALLSTMTQPVQGTDMAWSCDDSVPAVCVPVDFERFLPEVKEALALSGIAGLVSAASDRTADALHVDDSLLFAELDRHGIAFPNVGERLGDAIYSTLVSPGCFPADDQPVLDDAQIAASDSVNGWIAYMTMDPATLASYGVTSVTAYGAPDVQPGTPEADTFLADSLALLPACP